MKRTAVFYLSNGTLIFAPVIRTSVGVGLEVDPVRLDDPHDIVAMRNGLIAALEGSQRVVPHPSQDQWKGFFKPFQDAAGVRSFRAFMKDAKSIYIDATKEEIRLTPARNLGTRGGFKDLPDESITLPPDDIGGAVSFLQSIVAAKGC